MFVGYVKLITYPTFFMPENKCKDWVGKYCKLLNGTCMHVIMQQTYEGNI